MTRSNWVALDADSLAVIAEARGMHDPAPGVQAKVRRKLELSLAAGATVAWYGAAASAASAKLFAVAVSIGLASTSLWYAEHRHAVHAHSSALSTPDGQAFEANLHPAEPTPSDDTKPHAAPAPSASPVRLNPRPDVSRTGDLAAETQVLMQVNAAINRHDGAAALALLDDYDHRLKSKILFAERSAARVFALCTLGRLDAAGSEAQRFLQRFPRSPLVTRIRASCAAPSLTRPNAP